MLPASCRQLQAGSLRSPEKQDAHVQGEWRIAWQATHPPLSSSMANEVSQIDSAALKSRVDELRRFL